VAAGPVGRAVGDAGGGPGLLPRPAAQCPAVDRLRELPRGAWSTGRCPHDGHGKFESLPELSQRSGCGVRASHGRCRPGSARARAPGGGDRGGVLPPVGLGSLGARGRRRAQYLVRDGAVRRCIRGALRQGLHPHHHGGGRRGSRHVLVERYVRRRHVRDERRLPHRLRIHVPSGPVRSAHRERGLSPRYLHRG
jgi:hypothetical protein